MASRDYSRASLVERYGEPDHSEHVCAYCEAVEVAHRGDYCSPECELQDSIRDEDNANDYSEAL